MAGFTQARTNSHGIPTFRARRAGWSDQSVMTNLCPPSITLKVLGLIRQPLKALTARAHDFGRVTKHDPRDQCRAKVTIIT